MIYERSLNTLQIFIIVLIIVGILAFGIISYQGIKILRKRNEERTQILLNQCVDILNLDYIMVTDKKSGLNLYIQNFSERENEASLISGFLAISSQLISAVLCFIIALK